MTMTSIERTQYTPLFSSLSTDMYGYVQSVNKHNVFRQAVYTSNIIISYYFLWLCSPARAMASCGSAAQRGLWPPVALQPSAGYGLLWLCSPARAMVSSSTRFIDHTQRRATVGRTPLDEWIDRRRDIYLTTHNTHNRQTSMPPVGFEPTIAVGERS
jgi:hypothetical protein